MEENKKEIILSLSENISLLIESSKKRQKEINYIIERLKNLNALVNASESDVPKELVKNWISETIEELLKMEDIDPEKIGKQSEYWG